MPKAKTEETENTAALQVHSQFPVFSSIVYLNIKVGEEVYSAQTQIQGATIEQYMEAFTEFVTAIADKEGTPVYQPREIRAAGGQGGSASNQPAQKPQAPDAPEGVPPCPFHNIKLKTRTNRSTGQTFYACGGKKDDGSWCNWTPPQGG
jgi:hypothetical protein